MKTKVMFSVVSILAACSLFFGSDVYAGKNSFGGSSRSSTPRSPVSGSRYNSPSTGGYGNSGIKPEPGKNLNGGYGNSGTKLPGGVPQPPGDWNKSSGYGNSASQSQNRSGQAAPGLPKSSPLQNQMNRNFSKQESARAYEDYKTQQNRFQMSSGNYKPSNRETTTINSVSSRSGYGFGPDYYARRTVFYDSYRWSPPVYMYRSFNSFGIWDAMILWFMLDHIYEAQYAAMYYNHRDDPGMQQFRSEVERLSAENADLKAKLAKMDESAKSLEEQGVKPDPSYVPQDAAGIALAADIAAKEPPRSGGFPWTWVMIVVFVLLGMHFLRRRR